MSASEHVDGPGERLVALLMCIGRLPPDTDQSLRPPRGTVLSGREPDPESVLTDLRTRGPYELVEPFEAWQRLRGELEVAIAELVRMQDQDDHTERSRQAIDSHIDQTRQCHQAVEYLAADIRRRVAALIDLAAAHQIQVD